MSLIDFIIRRDERGSLVSIEQDKDVFFNIKRVAHIFDAKHGVTRGKHCHLVTKQLLVAVCGSCKVTLDNGINKIVYELNKPDIGLFQDALIWGEMHDFSEDCVLLVLASDYFDESDYIRDYSEFLELVKS